MLAIARGRWTWAPYIAVGVALIFGAAWAARGAVVQYRLDHDLQRRGQESGGTILRARTVPAVRGAYFREIVVRFEDSQGKAHEVTMPAGDEFDAGKAVTVLYDPGDPERARPQSWSPIPWWLLAIVVPGCLLLGVALIRVGLRERKRPPRRRLPSRARSGRPSRGRFRRCA